MIRVSIITICRNAESTIESTIQSVLAQTHPNIQYIIVDGLSTDSTMSVVSKYQDKISVVVSEKDKGLYDALNKGISLADGDVIGVVHADDVLASNDIISVISDEFVKDHSLMSVIGDIAFVNERGKQVRYYSSRSWNPSLFRYGMMPPHPSFYCRRQLFEQYGVYRTDFKIGSDYELLLRFLSIHWISFRYVSRLFVLMKPGGISTSGISSFLTINKEIMRASRMHKIKTNYLFVFSRYLVRIFQFFPLKQR
ncbi:MAG: glycosyltransferase family 2 protein [bacterium]|jgi:glycosyltransferase involved in cell wall biosynthesis